MRILCLHGRGSNNDIFKMQTAPFRSLLDDYEFDFVQGQMPHVEGNWSLHTTEFASSKLWGYYNMLDLEDVMNTEREVLQLAEEDGPYDGILGYSQGGTLTSQVLIRHGIENPRATALEMPFRFAIFFNTATPSHVTELEDPSIVKPYTDYTDDEDAQLFYQVMRKNPLLHKTKYFPGQLPNGRKVLTDMRLAMYKCEAEHDGTLIKLPTLHVRCPGDKEDYGHGNYQLCDPTVAKQYFHRHGHDFPRGYDQMRDIARLIREVAESAS